MEERIEDLEFIGERGRPDLILANFINVRLARTTARLTALFRREALKPNGLSLQEWRILLSVARLGECHLRELSRFATIDPGHASRSTRNLVERGLLRREDDPGHANKARFTATAEGHEIIDRIWPIALGITAEITERVGEDAIRSMNAGLDAAREYAIRRLNEESAD